MRQYRKDPLRVLTEQERLVLEQISRSSSERVDVVIRAKEVLAVASGHSYSAAAAMSGRRSGQAVSNLMERFNRNGLAAVQPHGGGGTRPSYDPSARERILAEARRTPDPAQDGTATWSLSTLRRALRRAPDGLPHVSTYTISQVLHAAGFLWLTARSWCDTGKAVRKRRSGTVTVIDLDAEAKKSLIERAYREGERLGLAVWTEDEAGPYQTRPYPGRSWGEQGQPKHQPHQYVRNGIAKLLTLFCPRTGEVRAKGVITTPNTVLHPWLKHELKAILAHLPQESLVTDTTVNRAVWESWQQGLNKRITLPASLPLLRLLLIWDNLKGHQTSLLVLWLLDHGVMPLYTPLSGSWLNMAESVQRIIGDRALAGQYPHTQGEIINALEATVKGWNQAPTPFQWGGKRHARRLRSQQRRHALGGSGACTHDPVRRRQSVL